MSSFATEINAILTADPSINELVNGGIHYENLPDNWVSQPTNDKWIVYEFSKTQTDCLNSKNAYSTYTLSVVVIQRDNNSQVDVMTNMVIGYLNNLTSGNIQDIGFTNDETGFNQQQNTYTNTLDFNCFYVDS